MSSEFSPRPHQTEGAAWLRHRHRALIHDDPGCGKTAQSILAAQGFDWPTMVVCPAVALGVWAREIAHVMPGATVRVQETRDPVEPPRPGEWVLTTYDRASIATEPGVRPNRFGVILDEAHYVK